MNFVSNTSKKVFLFFIKYKVFFCGLIPIFLLFFLTGDSPPPAWVEYEGPGYDDWSIPDKIKTYVYSYPSGRQVRVDNPLDQEFWRDDIPPHLNLPSVHDMPLNNKDFRVIDEGKPWVENFDPLARPKPNKNGIVIKYAIAFFVGLAKICLFVAKERGGKHKG
jgi:hypothetical protein